MLKVKDSYEEISISKQIVKFATVERQRGLNIIYNKHILFHRRKLGKNVDLQNIHSYLLKSPRGVLQNNTLSQQWGLGSQLKKLYTNATYIPLGLFTPKQLICYDTAETAPPILSKFYLSERTETEFLEDDYTIGLYIRNISIIFSRTSKTIHLPLSKKSRSVPQRKTNNFATRRARGSPKKRRFELLKKIVRTLTKKNFTAWIENNFRLALRLTIIISDHSSCSWTVDIVWISLVKFLGYSNTKHAFKNKKHNWNKREKKRNLTRRFCINQTRLELDWVSQTITE